MAFTQSTFATVGAQAAPSPTVYSYASIDDLTTVITAGYFSDKSGQLEEGDIIFASLSDGYITLEVDSDTSTAKEAPTPSGLDNVKNVNSVDDLPEAAGGVIELTGGLDKCYLIKCAELDIGSNLFTVTGGSVAMSGCNPFASAIKSIGAGDLFTVSNASINLNNLQLDCVNANTIDFDNSVPTSSVNWQTVVVLSALGIGNIKDAFSATMRAITVSTTTVKGLTFTGTSGNQINFSNWLALNWTGILWDLGSAKFDKINMSPTNRLISPGGTTILSGLASNGNLNAGGEALVASNFFNGTGIKLNGISVKDSQYRFTGNSGLTDSENIGCFAVTTPAASTPPDIGEFSPIAGTTTACLQTSRFTQIANNKIRYDGILPIDVVIHISASASKSGTASAVEVAAFKSTDDITYNDVNANAHGAFDATTRTASTSIVLRDTATNGDIYSAYWANFDNTNDVTFSVLDMDVSG